MDEISQSEKDHIIELVSSQKRAKLVWISAVTEIPVDIIIANAEDLGLVIDGEFIVIPEEKESLPVVIPEKEESTTVAIREEESYKRPLKIVKQNKIKKILLIILAILMIIIPFPFFVYGGFLIFCGAGWGEVWAIFTGIAIIIGGLASCIFGIGILINQRYR